MSHFGVNHWGAHQTPVHLQRAEYFSGYSCNKPVGLWQRLCQYGCCPFNLDMHCAQLNILWFCQNQIMFSLLLTGVKIQCTIHLGVFDKIYSHIRVQILCEKLRICVTRFMHRTLKVNYSKKLNKYQLCLLVDFSKRINSVSIHENGKNLCQQEQARRYLKLFPSLNRPYRKIHDIL